MIKKSFTQEEKENFLEKELKFWKEKLRDLSPLALPTDFPRPPALTKPSNSIRFSLEPELRSRLESVGRSHNTSFFNTLLAAFKVLLFRYSGQEDICIGTPIHVQDQQEPAKECFVNYIALRSHVQSSMSFPDLLKLVTTTTDEAFANGQIPIDKVVESLGQEKDLSRNPVYQVLFSYQNAAEGLMQLPEKLRGPGKVDLKFDLNETAGNIEGRVEYAPELYKQETIERMIGHFIQLLDSITAEPSSGICGLRLMSDNEEQLVLNKFNSPHAPLSGETTILDIFEEQVRKSPAEVAVVFEGKNVTYQELNEKANQLAHYLSQKGVRQESLVPICLDRSLEMVIGIMGILKSGGAYVPIDPTYPEDRIRFVLQDSKAEIVLTNTESISLFQPEGPVAIIDLEKDWPEIAKESSKSPNQKPQPNHLAYVIYTSGSTGKPKGVLIEHRGLSSSTLARKSYYGSFTSALLIPSFAFDSSVAVIFGTLATGGKLLLCRSETIKEPRNVKSLLKETETILCVPSYYRFLLEEGLLENTILSKAIVAGENLDDNLVALHFEKIKHVALYNEYGPTEGTVWATVAQIKPKQKVTIGKPIANTSVYIAGKGQALNPIGIPGELCIAGEGVTRGYLNRPDLTAGSFVDNPFDKAAGTTMYRTGDLARWLPDGNLEYLGRIDNQVKIRGYRVELGEIEATINKLADIKESVVTVLEDTPGNKRLIAYAVCHDHLKSMPEPNRKAALRKELSSLLPHFMLPGEWVFLDRLPLTANNKIDRKKLPKPEEIAEVGAGPATPTEEKILEIWCKFLKRNTVDVEADFFEIGGHSLMAIKIVSALEEEFQMKLPFNLFFKNPNIRDLGKCIDGDKKFDGAWSSLVPINPDGTKPPLYIVHGAGSTIGIYYRLATQMDRDQPLYGFQPKGLNGTDSPHKSIEEMAAYYISLMIKHNPEGPYHLGGYSFGAYVAYEMAKQLKAMGKRVENLILFDSRALEVPRKMPPLKKLKWKLGKRTTDLLFMFKEPEGYFHLKQRSLQRKKDKLVSLFKKPNLHKQQNDYQTIVKRMRANNVKIMDEYKVTPYDGDLYLVKAKNRRFYVEDKKYYGWGEYVHNVKILNVGGHHDNMFHKPQILKEMAVKVQQVLDQKEVYS